MKQFNPQAGLLLQIERGVCFLIQLLLQLLLVPATGIHQLQGHGHVTPYPLHRSAVGIGIGTAQHRMPHQQGVKCLPYRRFLYPLTQGAGKGGVVCGARRGKLVQHPNGPLGISQGVFINHSRLRRFFAGIFRLEPIDNALFVGFEHAHQIFGEHFFGRFKAQGVAFHPQL